MSRKLVVLDFNGVIAKINGSGKNISVSPRPRVKSFLESIVHHEHGKVDIAIWTSRLPSNADKAINLFSCRTKIPIRDQILSFLWDRSHCDLNGNKDITKIPEAYPRYNLTDIVVIDDDMTKIFGIETPGTQFILCPTYLGPIKCPDDNVLMQEILPQIRYFMKQ